jgi:hypothetical protein
MQTWGEKQLSKIYRKEEKREIQYCDIFKCGRRKKKGTVIH